MISSITISIYGIRQIRATGEIRFVLKVFRLKYLLQGFPIDGRNLVRVSGPV